MAHPLLRLREKLNLTQHELSRAAHVGQSNISHYECGSRYPVVKTAIKLIRFAKSKGMTILLHEFYEDLK